MLESSQFNFTPQQLAQMDIPEMLNHIYETSILDQHNFMYVQMVPVLMQMLEEVMPACVTANEQNTLSQLTLQLGMLGGPYTNHSWDWSEYYHYLALNGLQNCDAFKTEIANFNVYSNIIVNPTEACKFQQYNSYSNANMSHTCN